MNEQKINRGTHGDSLLILVSLETLSKKPPLQAWNAKWWEYVTHVLTEDAKSGFQFYGAYFDPKGIKSHTSKSNSAIFSWLKKHCDDNVFIIADGAAFGSEIDRVLKLSGNFRLCLPESFEWLILKSGVVRIDSLEKVLSSPSDYIESKDYFSWEQFFHKYLVSETVNTPFQYSKDKINAVYLQEKNLDRIISEIL